MINVAIDGPVASGKTSLAREVAKKLNYRYLDTGAMYRAITWKAVKNNIDLQDEYKLAEMSINTNLEIIHSHMEPGYRVLIDGLDITEELTSSDVRNNVSIVASKGTVRKIMVEQQQRMARDKGVIMAGRDICNVVMPDAELKIFLTASAEERARRRYKEIIEKGENITLEKVLEEVKYRDKLDSERKHSPLMKASDTMELDCTDKSLDEVVIEVVNMVRGEK